MVIFREQSETLSTKKGIFVTIAKFDTLVYKRLSIQNKAKLSELQGANTFLLTDRQISLYISIEYSFLYICCILTDVAEEILGLLCITIKSLMIQIGVGFVQHIIR